MSDDALKQIAEIQKQLGLSTETAALEAAIKAGHDKLLGVIPEAESAAKSHTDSNEG